MLDTFWVIFFLLSSSIDSQFLLTFENQDSDDEGNDEHESEEKITVKREFTVRSPSPPAEDSEPELTDELKEELLVGSSCHIIPTSQTVGRSHFKHEPVCLHLSYRWASLKLSWLRSSSRSPTRRSCTLPGIPTEKPLEVCLPLSLTISSPVAFHQQVCS